MPKTHVAFVGFSMPEELIAGDSRFSVADNRMQQSYQKALRMKYDSSLFLSLPLFPISEPITQIDGLPTMVMRSKFKHQSIWAEIDKWAQTTLVLYKWARGKKSDKCVILCFHTFLSVSVIAKLVAVLSKNIRLVSIAIVPLRSENGRRFPFWLNRKILKSFHGVIGITQTLTEELAGGGASLVISGAVDKYFGKDDLRDRVPAPRKVVYAGEFSKRYNLIQIARAAWLLRENNIEVHFYGSGELAPRLLELENQIVNFFVHDPISKERIYKIQSECDLVLVLLETDRYASSRSFPSKIFEAIASGAPVLSTDLESLNTEIRKVVKIVGDLTPEGIASSIETSFDKTLQEKSARQFLAKEYVSRYATWEGHAQTISDFIEGL